MTKTETHTNKTILRVLFAAAVVLLFCGAAVGAVAGETGEVAAAFPGPGNVPGGMYTGGDLQAGVYTLLGDVTLQNANLTVSNGVTCTIDLNGHVLKGTGSSSVITVNSGGNLTVQDSPSTAVHKFTVGPDGLWTLNETEGTKPLTGGCITGGKSASGSGGGVKVSGGTFMLSGGNIVGNTANIGGGVYIGISGGSSGSFKMNNGCIIGNTAKDGGGGGVNVQNGTFTMTGGTISENTATKYGGGVRVYTNGTFKVSGTPVIKDNMQTDGTTADNVYLTSDRFITVTDDALTYGASIGITSPQSGKFGTFESTPTDAQKTAAIASFNLDSDATIPCLVTGNDLYWPVAKIEANYYATVQAAVDAAAAGQTITMIANSTEAPITIPAGKTITLDLAGYELKGNGGGSVITISAAEGETPAGNLTLTDSSENKSGKITGGKAAQGGGVFVDAGAAFTMEGGSITGNTATEFGGGVEIGEDATFTMEGGSITGNIAEYGGGVDVSTASSEFTMSGGTIGGAGAGDGNSAENGGGVYVFNGGSFTMFDSARIIGNTATKFGGGVDVGSMDVKTSFTMSDSAIITGNTAKNGGGVFIAAQYGEFTMNGGTISKNKATSEGGGVGVTDGTFTMTGGTISENEAATEGGGVDVLGTFNVSGTPVIKGNTLSGGTTANNVFLSNGKFITVTGALTNGASIGIASPLGGKFGAFDSSFTPTDEQKTAAIASFHLDSDATIPCLVTGNDLYWPVAKIGTNYYATVQAAVDAAAAGQTITMIADSTEPMITVGKKVTLDLNGHVLKNDGSESDKSVIKVITDGDLEVTDTSTTGNEHYFKFVKNGPWTLYDGTPASSVPLADFDRAAAEAATGSYFVKVTGGCITGGTGYNEGGIVCGGGVYVNGGTFVLDGGHIVGNSVSGTQAGFEYYGGGIYVKSNSTFEMKDGSIAGNTATKNGGGVYNGGTFTMSNSASIVSNTSSDSGGGVYNGGTFTMSNSASIVSNTSSDSGGGVYVAQSSEFTMNGGTISKNKATGDGGGVSVLSSSFTMNNGTISENTAQNGGGVYAYYYCQFTMSNSASIVGNTATNNGGGVCVYDGTFIMNGGTIGGAGDDDGNTATNGGGVYLRGFPGDPCTFEMSGSASITDNTATGNGGGVFISSDSKLSVSGSPSIKGNKGSDDADNNVVLEKVDTDVGLFLTDNFTGEIRITLVGGKVPAAGEPFGWVTVSPSGAENFKADGSNLFGSISDGKLVWKAPASKPSSKPQGSSVWATIPVIPAGSADPREAAAHVVTEDISKLYIGTVFTPVSSAEITQIEAVSPESAALLTAALDAAAADGIPLTNSKGAKAIVNTAEKIPGAQTTAAFTQVFNVESSDGTWVTAVPFKVRLSDLSAKNLTTDDVTLYHYLEEYDIWIPLETGLVSTDDEYAYYEAATDGASPFGVLLKKLDVPQVKPVTPTGTPAKTPVPFLGVLAGLGAAAAVFGLRRK